MNVSAWFTNKEGVVDMCNKAACSLLDREESDVLGADFATGLVVDSDRDAASKCVAAAVSGEESAGTFLTLVNKQDVSVDMGPRRVRGEVTGSMVLAQRARHPELASFKIGE